MTGRKTTLKQAVAVLRMLHETSETDNDPDNDPDHEDADPGSSAAGPSTRTEQGRRHAGLWLKRFRPPILASKSKITNNCVIN